MQNDETAISLDMGFYMKFKVDEATGDPYSCKGIEKPGYKTYGRGQAGFVTSESMIMLLMANLCMLLWMIWQITNLPSCPALFLPFKK